MKSIKLFAILFACTFLTFNSCKKSDYLSKSSELTLKNVKERILKIGLDTTGLWINGNKIIVEGDISLSLSSLNNTVPRQVTPTPVDNSGPISYANQRDIKYWVSPALIGQNWEMPIHQAISAITNVSFCRISFQYVTNESEADLKFLSGTLPLGYLGLGSWPDGQIGNTVTFDLNQTNNLNQSQKTYLAVHETGHNIGLAHTNVSGYRVPGTPNIDSYSIFNSGVSPVPNWTNLSFYDDLAIKYLYPSFSGELVGANEQYIYPGKEIYSNVAVNSRFANILNITFEWVAQGANVIGPTNTSSVHIVVTDPNSAAIYCTVRNGFNEVFTVSKSFGEIYIE